MLTQRNKRIFSGALAFLLLLSLISCGNARNSFVALGNESALASSPSDSSVSQTNIQSSKPSVRNLMDLAPIVFHTYEEYLVGIKDLDLPDNFIHYESISHLGAFDYFAIYNLDGQESQYVYDLQVNNEFQISLTIDHSFDNTPVDCFFVRNVNKINLRDLHGFDLGPSPASAKHVFHHGELIYIYRDLELRQIQWAQGGFSFTIGGWLYLYPENESTVIGKLLNKDLALSAYEEYILPITEKKPPEPPPSTDTAEPDDSAKEDSPAKLLIVAAVSAASGAAVATVVSICIAVSKKKKKAASKTDE